MPRSPQNPELDHVSINEMWVFLGPVTMRSMRSIPGMSYLNGLNLKASGLVYRNSLGVSKLVSNIVVRNMQQQNLAACSKNEIKEWINSSGRAATMLCNTA